MARDNIPYFEDEESKLLPNLPIVERDTVNVVVKNRDRDEYLCLHWKKFNWKTFVIGGIEKDEDVVTAAAREIKEETGYIDVKCIAEPGKIRSGYYAAHKKENRISNTVVLLFELISNKKVPVIQSEVMHHVHMWVSKNEVVSFVNLKSQQYIWEKVLERVR